MTSVIIHDSCAICVTILLSCLSGMVSPVTAAAIYRGGEHISIVKSVTVIICREPSHFRPPRRIGEAPIRDGAHKRHLPAVDCLQSPF